MGLSNLFGGTQPMQSIPGTQPFVDPAFAEDTATSVDGVAETLEPGIDEPTYTEASILGEDVIAPTEAEMSVGVESEQTMDLNCPLGYKPVVIYVPEDMLSTNLPVLPVSPDGRIEPPAEASGFDLNRDQLPWLNPELFQFENGYDPYIGIRPEGQELPGSIQYDDVPSGEIQVPDASQGWWENMMDRFQQISLVEKIQEAINEKRAALAQDGVEPTVDHAEFETGECRY